MRCAFPPYACYRAHMDYVHFNPVKHGFVAHPADWPYSTFQKCGALGLYDEAWAPADNNDVSSGMGERNQRWRNAPGFRRGFPPYAC